MKSNADAAVLRPARTRTADFVALAKPRLNLLVVASALAGYAMAGGDTSQVVRLLCTVLGTALVAGGASAYNQVLERDADALMQRTVAGRCRTAGCRPARRSSSRPRSRRWDWRRSRSRSTASARWSPSPRSSATSSSTRRSSA